MRWGLFYLILDNSGNIVVEYKYDVWGNHVVLYVNGANIISATYIGNFNPFRYRGYYYDTEIGGILALGGAAGLASAKLISFGMTTGTAFGVSLGVGAAAGMVSYSLENGLRTDREWSVGGMFKAGFAGLVKGGATFAIGFVGGKAGAFDKLALKGLL